MMKSFSQATVLLVANAYANTSGRAGQPYGMCVGMIHIDGDF